MYGARRYQMEHLLVHKSTVEKIVLLSKTASTQFVLLVGPPGCGKTMVARRVCDALPKLTDAERLEVTMLRQAARLWDGEKEDWKLCNDVPFRAPHHTISEAALCGGGKVQLRPGEVSLAHNGVLFLDELPEFRLSTLVKALQNISSGAAKGYRHDTWVTFPARPKIVIATMNRCPCGHTGSTRKRCLCSMEQKIRYWNRIASPLSWFRRRINL